MQRAALRCASESVCAGSGQDGAPLSRSSRGELSDAPPEAVSRRGRLDQLRARIRALETDGAGALRAPRPRLEPATPPGETSQETPANDEGDALAPFRAQAGLHDVRPSCYLDAPAAYAFCVHWLAGLPGERALVWVRSRGEARLDFGAPCPDGLAQSGLDPARLLVVEARTGPDALWAMEEALKAGAFVFGEVGAARGYDLTASRRLHHAARENGTQILVLRAHDSQATSAALTRWSLSARAGKPAPWRGAGGLPGLGSLRLCAVLERRRGGPPDQFQLEWSDHALRSLEPAALADRPAQAASG